MIEEINTDVNEVINLAESIQESEHPDGQEMDEWCFTNDKTNPMIRQLFHLLMESAFKNKLGLMHAKVRDKDEVHTLIVGVENTEDGVITWPIAKILTEDQQGLYAAPDGQGNYAE